MTLLKVDPAGGESFQRTLHGDEIVLGRSSDADLALDDPFVSQRHARLYREGGAWWIEDLNSRNGTFVDDERIDGPRRISPDDEIRICATRLSLRPEPAPEPDGEIGSRAGIFRPASEILERQESSREEGRGERTPEAHRLEILNEVHRALNRAVTLEELLEVTLDRVFEYLEPEEGAVFLRGEEDEFDRVASRKSPDLDGEYLYSETLLEEVARKGMAALLHDLQTDDHLGEASSILDVGIRSLIAAPLLHPEGSRGMIALNSRAEVREFSPEDLELLVSVASAAALRVRNVDLTEELAERKRLERELRVAREIQLSLLPDRLPEVPGWDLYGSNIPSRGVSGDYYEIVPRKEGRELVLVLADVVGKGLPASLLTACLEALSAGPIEDGLAPAEILRRLSRRLLERTPPERFATAFLAVLVPETGRILFANAGHNPPLLLRASGEAERLPPTGMPVGALTTGDYEEGSATVGSGDLLVLFTDGIVEAKNPREEEYGADRFTEICLANRNRTAKELAEAVDADLVEFVDGVPFADDRTLVIARREDSPAPAPSESLTT